MNNATDLIAKLLANEDLTVVQASVPTASFNIKTRVLTLPVWKDASDDLIGMLVGHEVGHALWTTDAYLTHDMIETEYAQSFQTYLNVLEDVRIEKLMKRKYPGIRKTFNIGYTELNEKDFFETKDKDFDDMLLIDRINLYFKAGYNCGVYFTKKEKTFVERTERTETIEEVIELAKDIFDYTKSELEDALQKAAEEQAQSGSQSGADSGGDTDDDEMDLDDDSTPSTGSSKSDSINDMLESKTERAYQKNVNDLADVNTVYNYYKPGKFEFDPFVSYKEVMANIKRTIERQRLSGNSYFEMTPERMQKVTDLKSSSTPVVSYLIKEFEMKKAATAYKRTTIARTGQLDMRKIYAYKLQDDLFKRVASVKNGKNHGMLFLLDWSGSMNNCIGQTLDQVINLAMFCRSAQIPFQVMAFADSFATESYKQVNRSLNRESGYLHVNDRMALLEFFNHKMSTSEFNDMITLTKTFARAVFSMSGTPLNQALSYMLDHVAKFKKQYNVEKMTFITLTDGQGETMSSTDGRFMEGEYNGKIYKNFILDDVTGKSYAINKYNAETFTTALLNMIKERHGVTTLGFYLSSTSYGSLHGVLNSHYLEPVNIALTIDRMKKEFKERGYASLKGTGRDELFVVPLQSKIENTTVDSIKADGSAAAIARQFGKVLNKRKTSRVLLSRFIDYVA